jgi:predicted aminopeptidase
MIGSTAMILGCTSVAYYAQSIHGQWDMLVRSQPITDVIRQPETTDTLKRKLTQVLEIRRFASDVLSLPDNGSYTRYADLGRRYAVWNVFAAPEYSLTPEKWCFPIIGCVVYRGYFKLEDAQRFAERLEQQDKDVFIGGVPAYSTLGWFTDPMLNTVMHYSDEDLAGLVFHELAHQLVYVKDDSVFNESFATTVELEGVRRWIQAGGDASRINAYRERKVRDRKVIALILNYKERLSQIYASDTEEVWMRTQKHALISELRDQFQALVLPWNGYDRFAQWFSGPINNAKLVAVVAYHDLVPAFEAMLTRHRRDLDKFFAEVKELASLSKDARNARLSAEL